MTHIEVQESYTDHGGGEFSAVNVRVVATWSAPTCVENLPSTRPGRFSSASIPIQEAKLLGLEVGEVGWPLIEQA